MTGDLRMYLTRPGFHAAVKVDGPTLRCYRANEGEDHYHFIATGEIHLSDGSANYCMNCAFAQGFIAAERPSLEKSARLSLTTEIEPRFDL